LPCDGLGYWVQMITRIAATASIGVPETAIRQQNEIRRYAMRTINDSFRRPLLRQAWRSESRPPTATAGITSESRGSTRRPMAIAAPVAVGVASNSTRSRVEKSASMARFARERRR
jgi:hypothetical protein